MRYGVILAGGCGKRVKSAVIPKQFIEIDDKPIIVYTLQAMLEINRFDYIYVAVHADFKVYMQECVDRFLGQKEKIIILLGGTERMDSIDNVLEEISKRNELGENDIVVIHDAVRPLVPAKILNDSIDCAEKFGACVAGLAVSDTILRSIDGEVVSDIPIRSELYQGQSPDSFNLVNFIKMKENLTPEQRKSITGTSQICTYNAQPIHIIEGDALNFKITTDSDLTIFRKLLGCV